MAGAGFVYFVQARQLGLVKIGIAKDMKRRLRALQCGSPDQLRVLGVIWDERPLALEREAQTQKAAASNPERLKAAAKYPRDTGRRSGGVISTC